MTTAQNEFGHPATPEEGASLLLESIEDYAIFMLDPDGRVITWNHGAQRIKGYTPDAIIGKHFSVFYPDEDKANGKAERMLEIARREGRVEDEGWRLRADGSRFWANVIIVPVRDSSGKLVGFTKTTRDVTDRRMAEQALHESEQRFRLLVEAVRDYAIFMVSPDGIVMSWNSGAERIKGYTSEEILGKHFSMFYPKEDAARGEPERELEVALAEGRYEEEGWRVRKDGTHFWANVTITPVRDREERLIGFAKVTRDMTERRQAREEISASRRKLHDLASENLAKDEFLGVVAHELRTPLSVLYGGTRLLAQRYDQLGREDRMELVNSLSVEADRMRTLIESLMVLVNPSPTLDLVECSVNEQIRAAIAQFERESDRRTVALALPDEEILAKLDASLFQRIVLNLLSNADKYSPKDQPIEVAARADERQMVIEVLDRGPGVEATDLQLIFTSFYRSERAIQSAPGKGLGLAICKRLVELMGGEIEARLRTGGGLIVRFTVPRA
ncbi:MAG: PAS domain S-box protein [Hyphomicrobiales bacterium]